MTQPIPITGKETTMEFKLMTTIVALALVTGAASVSAEDLQVRHLLTKDCSTDTFEAGGFCTITYSNLPAIAVGSKLFYEQAPGFPSCSNPTTISQPCPSVVYFIDSNVLLYVGAGDWAHGRCTYDIAANNIFHVPGGAGLCNFSDGIGQLAGFRASADVSPSPQGKDNCFSTACYRLDGTYSLGFGEERE